MHQLALPSSGIMPYHTRYEPFEGNMQMQYPLFQNDSEMIEWRLSLLSLKEMGLDEKAEVSKLEKMTEVLFNLIEERNKSMEKENKFREEQRKILEAPSMRALKKERKANFKGRESADLKIQKNGCSKMPNYTKKQSNNIRGY